MRSTEIYPGFLQAFRPKEYNKKGQSEPLQLLQLFPGWEAAVIKQRNVFKVVHGRYSHYQVAVLSSLERWPQVIQSQLSRTSGNLNSFKDKKEPKIHRTYLPRQGETRAIKQAFPRPGVTGFVSNPVSARQELNQGLAVFAVSSIDDSIRLVFSTLYFHTSVASTLHSTLCIYSSNYYWMSTLCLGAQPDLSDQVCLQGNWHLFSRMFP